MLTCGTIERFSSYIEKFSYDNELREQILFFMHSCFQTYPSLKHVMPAVRTFVKFLKEWRHLNEVSLTKILMCMARVFVRNADLLLKFAEAMLEPLIEIFKEHESLQVRERAVNILGDVCATPSTLYSIRVLEAGYCNQLSKLVMMC